MEQTTFSRVVLDLLHARGMSVADLDEELDTGDLTARMLSEDHASAGDVARLADVLDLDDAERHRLAHALAFDR